jgi:DNA-binding SARP family transcriptional activator
LLRLRTFGGLCLDARELPTAGSHEVTRQRRPLLVLAILAAGGDQGVSRDRLLHLLWPDSDTSRARGALKQTLFRLRRELGEPDVIVGSTDLLLNQGRISSDVGDFVQAVSREELESAVGLYTGPFLDGVHLSNAPEFERWLDRQHDRLAADYRAALQKLANRACERGSVEEAVSWLRPLATADPLNSRTAMAYMRALAAAGDRAAAIEHARIHSRLLESELEARPDPEVLALAERLRVDIPAEQAGAHAPGHSHSETVVSSQRAALEVLPVGPRSDHEPQHGDARIARETETAARAADRFPARRWLWGIAALAVLVAGALLIRWFTLPGQPTAPRANVIAIMPFSVTGDRYAYLREGMVDLLSARLNDAGEIRTVAPQALLSLVSRASRDGDELARNREIARAARAQSFVMGSVVDAGARLHLSATIFDRDDEQGARAQTSVEGRPEDLPALVDELAVELLARMYDSPAGRLTRSAASSTRSVEALKAFLEGQAEFRAGRYSPAMEAFQRAVAADTGFALAYYRLSVAAEWASRIDIAQEAAARAAERSDVLSEHDRQLLTALVNQRQGRLAEAERAYQVVTAAYPDDVEAWYQLGEIQFHSGPERGRSIMRAREAFERVLLFEPNNREVLAHLLRIAAKQRRLLAVDSIADRINSIGPAQPDILVEAMRVFTSGDHTAQERLILRADQRDDEVLLTMARHVALYTTNLDAARELAVRLARRAGGYSVSGNLFTADLELARGRWVAAQQFIEVGGRIGPVSGPSARALYLALPFLEISSSVVDSVRRELALLRPAVEDPCFSAGYMGTCHGIQWYASGLLSAVVGDDAEAARYAAILDTAVAVRGRIGSSHFRLASLAAVVRAAAHYGKGEWQHALASLDSTHVDATFGDLSEMLGSHAYARFLRAEVLRELDRPQEALRWYGTLGELSTHELAYVGPAHLRQAQLYERLGDGERAAHHYSVFLDLWRQADPQFQPLLADARRSLKRLKE